MKIVELRAENVKRLQAVEIKPDGSLVVIGGKNGAGKSSVLDAILYGLSGAKSLPGKPVRNGADKAEIEIKLDGKPSLVIKRRIKPDGSTTLTVEQVNEDGSRASVKSPQAMLDSLYGAIAFDPLAFTRMRPQEQVELLRAAVGVSVDDLDAKAKAVFDERTGVNRDVKQLESQLAGMPEHKDAPAVEVSASDVLKEIEAANAANESVAESGRAIEALQQRRDGISLRIGNVNARIDELERELAALEAEKDALADDLNHADDKLAMDRELNAKLVVIDLAPLKAKLAGVEGANAKVRANKQRADKAEQLAAAKAQADDLSKQLDQLRKARIDRMAAAKWPVEGLGFGEAGVTFNELPFDQCSSAEQLRISTAIALSQNPKLPIGFVRDGSLLDEESLRMVAEIADQYGAQIWIERVGNGDECSIVIEDGSVAEMAVA
jgi:DNA repair exonuclease SbcCD ATPase subunit